jgi:hypothetical protein
MFRPVLGLIQAFIQWIPGASSPRVKRSDREADHSPSPSTAVNSDGAIPPFPHTSQWFCAQLTKHRDNFAFFTYIIVFHHTTLHCPLLAPSTAHWLAIHTSRFFALNWSLTSTDLGFSAHSQTNDVEIDNNVFIG